MSFGGAWRREPWCFGLGSDVRYLGNKSDLRLSLD
jgi:hypothetical protein